MTTTGANKNRCKSTRFVPPLAAAGLTRAPRAPNLMYIAMSVRHGR